MWMMQEKTCLWSFWWISYMCKLFYTMTFTHSIYLLTFLFGGHLAISLIDKTGWSISISSSMCKIRIINLNLTESAFQSRILTPKRLWNLFSSFQLQIMNLIVLTCWSSLSKLEAYIWTPLQHSGQFWRFGRICMIACHMEVAQSLAFWFIDSAFKQQTKIIREKSKINCTPN